MTSIMRRRLLAVTAIAVLVALLAVTMQAVFAEDNTFVTTAGNEDGSWPWESAYGTAPVGNPSDTYHAAINHWNPASNGSISAEVKDGDPITEAMTIEVTDWHDEPSGSSLDWSRSASIVHWNGTAWEWSPNNPSHAPAAYPDFFQGCHWGQCTRDNSDYGRVGAGMPYPIQVGGIKDLYSTYEIAVTGDAAGTGTVWNASFDIWLDKGERPIEAGWYHPTAYDGDGNPTTIEEINGNFIGWKMMPSFPGSLLKYRNADGTENPKFAQLGQNDGAEIMIWMNNSGYNNTPITPAGTQVATGVSVPGITDGSTWDVWAARLQADGDPAVLPHYPAWNVISYVRTTGTTSMANFDANMFIQDAKNYDCPSAVRGTPTAGNKCVADSWWLTSVQAGFEIWAKGDGLKVSQFSVKPNTDTKIDTGRVDGDGNPLIHYDQKFLLRYKADTCVTGMTATVADNQGQSTSPIALRKTVVEVESGKNLWVARAGPINPVHTNADLPGSSTVTFTPTGCGSPEIINVFIDPSGHVVNTLGEPIENADVTLMYVPDVLSSDPEPDPTAYVPVPDQDDEIMCPPGDPSGCYGNIDNPDQTDATGFYRWDVADGWYKVQAEKTGCTSALSPALPVSEGNPATGVNLVLDCGGTPPGDLLVQLTTQNDWGTGYCKNVTITNQSASPVDWTVNFDVEGTIYNNWNFTFTRSGNTVTAQGVNWNRTLQAGETSHSIGFCANRTGGGTPGPTPPPGGLTVTVTTQSDWGTGYCANVTVRNNTSAASNWRVTFDVVGSVNNAWNAISSQSGNRLTMEGVSWNDILQPGASTHSIGFCAAR